MAYVAPEPHVERPPARLSQRRDYLRPVPLAPENRPRSADTAPLPDPHQWPSVEAERLGLAVAEAVAARRARKLVSTAWLLVGLAREVGEEAFCERAKVALDPGWGGYAGVDSDPWPALETAILAPAPASGAVRLVVVPGGG